MTPFFDRKRAAKSHSMDHAQEAGFDGEKVAPISQNVPCAYVPKPPYLSAIQACPLESAHHG